MIVPVAEVFRPYAEAALARLSYLYPEARFALVPAGVSIERVHDHDTIAKELKYALYREKVYAETLPMRRALVDAVTRR